MELYNNQTKKLEKISDDQFLEAVRSKQYDIKQDHKIPVTSPFGERGTIDASELESALNQGYEFEGFEPGRIRKEREEYDRPIAAGLLGAASGASFGTIPLALSKSGLVSEETQSKLKEYNEASHLTGEIGSILATLPLKFSPVGLVAGLGSKVATKTAEKIGANIAESTAAKIAKKAAAVGAGSAVEGTFYGTGQVISDTAIGRPPKNAEDIISTVGLSALLGGVLGGMFKGFQEGGPIALRRLSESAPIAVLRDVSHKATNLWADMSAFISGADKEHLRKAFAPTKEGAELRKAYGAGYLEQYEKKNKELTEFIKKQESAFKAGRKEFYDTLQPAERLIINEQVPLKTAIETVNGVTANTQAALRRMYDDPFSFPKADISKLETQLGKFVHDAQKAIDLGPEAPKKIFEVIEDYKRHFDETYFKAGHVGRSVHRNYFEEIKGISDNARNLLENPNIWGDAATRQQVINDAYTTFKRAEGPFMDFFGRGPKGRKKFDPSRMRAFTTKIQKESADEASQALTDRLQSMQDFIDKVATGEGGVIGAHMGARETIESELKALNQVRQTKWYTEREKGNSLLGFGAALAGVPVEAATAYVALSNPVRALQVISWLEKTIIGTNSRIYKNMEGFLKNEKVKTLSTGLEKVPLIYQNESASQKRKQYEESLEKYNELSAKPGDLINKISQDIGEFNEYAPGTSQALAQKMADAIGFLVQSLPKKESNTALPFSSEIPLSDYEINEFAKTERLVFNPLSILEDLNDNTISTQSVEVIKNLYPEIYKNITEQCMQAIMNLGDVTLPYQKKMSLSILLGSPLDNSLTSEFIVRMQQSNMLMRQENQNKQQQQKINAGQLAKSKSIDNLTTPFQSVINSV